MKIAEDLGQILVVLHTLLVYVTMWGDLQNTAQMFMQ